MIIDLLFGLLLIGALITGYKNGLIATLIRFAFFIGGAIAAMYWVVEYDKTGWLIAAIVTGAYASAWVGALLAKSLKVTVIRGPLRWLDSSAGAIFEATKYMVLFYVVGTILLWSPWSAGQNAISESKIYLQIDTRAPSVITEIRERVEELLDNPQI